MTARVPSTATRICAEDLWAAGQVRRGRGSSACAGMCHLVSINGGAGEGGSDVRKILTAVERARYIVDRRAKEVQLNELDPGKCRRKWRIELG